MTDAYTPPQSDMAEHNARPGAVTEEMVSALRGTKGWVLMFGIFMFIGAAFLVLGAIGMMAGGALMGAGAQGMPRGMFTGVGIMYILMACLYIFPAIFLVKYSSAIGRLLSSGHVADMEDALNQQRKFWKFVGVMALIGMVLAVVGIIAAIAVPIMMAAHG
ncbi:MAG TPA: DUF5362 family protein [Burkholderiaceae bacterium]